MTIEEWLGEDNQLGIDIFTHKYLFIKEDGSTESFDEWLDRVSAGNKDVKKLIKEKKFLFGGRILANRGLDKYGVKTTYSNCYVITPPEDNIESIFDTAKKMARTYSYGGGVGVDISGLAPNGARVHNASKTSSGACSFMDLYSMTTGLIGQNGRRGALMISLSCEHPDIEEFLDIKKDLNRVTKANISIRMTDKFMEAAKEGRDVELSFTRETGETITKTVNARDVLMHLAENNWEMAEPGCLFWDRIESWCIVSDDENFKFGGVNPCLRGDMKLLTVDGYKTFEELEGTEPFIINSDGDVVRSKVWCSGEKETVRLIFENHSDVVCTPEHVFKTIGEDEVMARNAKGITLKKPGLDSINYGYLVKDVTPAGKVKVYDFTEPKTHWGVVEDIVTHNCAEEPLPAGGSCLLGSINLAEFVNENGEFQNDIFEDAVAIGVKALNEVLMEGLPLHPLQEQRDSVNDWRQIGLGIMGLADMLIKMGIRYGSQEAIDICDTIGTIMAKTSITTSSFIASDEMQTYPKFNRDAVLASPYICEHMDGMIHTVIKAYGLYNSQLLTIAPTGTLSTMLGVSGGIEPIFANYYTRKTESLKGHDEYYKVYTPIVKDYMEKHGLSDDSELPDFFVTAGELDYKNRIEMQAAWQQHIDAAISSTVNLPNETTVEDIFDLYIRAWEAGLKGITVFRDGCARAAILSTSSSEGGKEEEENLETKRGYIYPTSDNLIGIKRSLISGCGSLHCEAFFTRDTGELREIYLSKGSKGGCNSFMTGLSRMISLAARGGVPFDKIVDQLHSTLVCPSFASRRASKHDTSRGSSCPNAVGYALIDMKKEVEEIVKVLNGDAAEVTIFGDCEVVTKTESCPNCGSLELSHTEGCITCPNCGWSRCS